MYSNNILNNSNRSLNYNSHLINTSHYTTPRSFISHLTNMYPSMLHNACPFTSCSTNSDTSFNDNIFQSNTPNMFHLNNTTFQSNNVESTSFRRMDNIHQVCSWLCENPNVLLLAYNMYLSMQVLVVNRFNFISSSYFNSSISRTAVPHA